MNQENKKFRLIPAFDYQCPDCNSRYKNTDYDGYKDHVLRDHGMDVRTGKKITKLLDTSGKNETYAEKVEKN